MHIFAEILIFALFLLFSVKVDGRDIGNFDPKSPLQTIVNESYFIERDDIKNIKNEEVNISIIFNQTKEDFDVLDEPRVELRNIDLSKVHIIWVDDVDLPRSQRPTKYPVRSSRKPRPTRTSRWPKPTSKPRPTRSSTRRPEPTTPSPTSISTRRPKPTTPRPTRSSTRRPKPTTPGPTRTSTKRTKPTTPRHTRSSTSRSKSTTPRPTRTSTERPRPTTPRPTRSSTRRPKPTKPTNQKCEINIRELPQRTPLLRHPKTKEIWYPDFPSSSVITLKNGEYLEIDCPGSSILVEGESTRKIIDAVCESGSHFKVSGYLVDFSDVLCQKKINSVAKYSGQRCFGSRGVEIEVGFEYTDGQFVPLTTSCFETEHREVFYTKLHLNHRIGYQQTGGTRPGWTEGKFYNLTEKLNKIYPNAAQRVQINRQLGLSANDTKYIKPTGNHYLAKGHLTARSDMFYYGEQEATFWYINSVPQWQSFNGFNWAYLEKNVRQLSASRKLDFEIITGGHGNFTLPHEQTGKPVRLYLYADENGNNAIPIPEIVYKVIYSPSTKQGVAILGLNNPYETDISKTIYCDDVAEQLTWLTFNRTRLDRGYTYACTISDLRKLIPELPDYRVTSLLKYLEYFFGKRHFDFVFDGDTFWRT